MLNEFDLTYTIHRTLGALLWAALYFLPIGHQNCTRQVCLSQIVADMLRNNTNRPGQRAAARHFIMLKCCFVTQHRFIQS